MTALSGAAGPWRRPAAPEVFDNTVVLVADRLGIQPLAVEKDYWVCEALRAIVAVNPGVVFKGGTSLAKLGIIERFSEDLDLLAPEVAGQGRTAAKSAMKKMCTAAVEATLSPPEEVVSTSGGTQGTLHREAHLRPPIKNQPASGTSAIADPESIQIEIGQSGGPNPHSTETVTSLLADALLATEPALAAHRDLQPFAVQVLHPGRTLLEKLLRVNTHAAGNDGRDNEARIGRQMYDIWALLGDERVLAFLNDRNETAKTLADCYTISKMFRPDSPQPDGGFAESPAFKLGTGLAARLARSHDLAMNDFYYGNETKPTFAEVAERVRSHAGLLLIEPTTSRA